MRAGANLRAAALGWIAWATISRLVRDGLRIGGRLVLARLLFPEAFGLYTLAVTVVVGLQMVCQLQFHSLLIRRATLTPSFVATACWSQVALGALGTLTLLLGAETIGTLLGDRRLTPVLQVLGFQLLLGGLSAVPWAWLVRQLDFRRLANRALVGEGVGIAVAVSAALVGAGVWSLVIQDLVVVGMDLLLVWSMVPWRLERQWRLREFRELFHFGSPLVGTNALQYLANQGDRLLIGRGFGSEALGFYAVALRLTDIVSEALGVIVRQVAFASFARVQEDVQRTARGFLEAARFQALVVFPLFMSMAVLADPLVPFILGPHWVGAIPFTRIVAARALLNSLGILPRTLLLARGRQWLLFYLGLVELAAFASGWLLGFPWGPLGIAAGGVAATLAVVLVIVRMAVSELSLGVAEWVRSLVPPVIGTAAMTTGMVLGPYVLPGLWPTDSVLRATALLFVGAGCYVFSLAPWLAREVRRQRMLLAAAFTDEDKPKLLGPPTA